MSNYHRKERNKKIRRFLIAMLTIQLFCFIFNNPYFFGENVVTDYIAEFAETINAFLVPNRHHASWKDVLLAFKESTIYESICKTCRWALPTALAANILEANLLSSGRFLRFVSNITESTTSGLLPRYKRDALKVYKRRPKGPAIDFKSLSGVRVQTFGEHSSDKAIIMNDGDTRTIYDARDELITLTRNGQHIYVCTDYESLPIGSRLDVTRLNSAGIETICEIYTKL